MNTAYNKPYRILKPGVLAMALMTLPLSAAIGQNLVMNPSFETLTSPPPASGSFTTYFFGGTATIPDWNVFVQDINLHHFLHGGMGVPPGGGTYHVDVNDDGGIRQTITLPGPGTYEFSFWRSVHSGVTCSPVNADFRIEDAGGAPIVSQSYTLSAADVGTWVQETGTFSAPGGTVDIVFQNNNSCYTFGGMLVDSVRVSPIQISDECSDICYWKVTGNNILNGNNIFGTRTKDDVRIRTSNANRGILTADGHLGWNTMAPTAWMHVNCAGNNPDDGSAGISDIRFERLEPGQGTILVINKDGYVFNSNRQIAGIPTDAGDLRNALPKVRDADGNLAASQVSDNGTSVGIGSNGILVSSYTYSTGAGGQLKLDVNGVSRALAFQSIADERFRADTRPVENAAQIIDRLGAYSFDWNDVAQKELNADKGRHIGFRVQELQHVLPEVVATDDKGNVSVNYQEIIPVLAQALKEQQQQIRELAELLKKQGNASGSAMTDAAFLAQNVPNPFSAATEIRYRLPENTRKAAIGIYDMNGKELKLVPVAQGSREGSVTISGGDLMPGMYLYSLVVDGRVLDTRKMILTSH